ncbi:MerR family transcriptional regulator [Lactobacillus sp. ESL0731]|uniref:MerR family transcriptional regulator n=1 Tax=unclassified Lactobacillus TaxID=2620435 RepID=UPI0023F748A5|nr:MULTISPECIES: MerR family transcriptional regulator [unclassified Lactobacillus]WEV50586.1 MerR family transcriptional regulator [Lactobacillus sp. ESL0700]WEV61716.1 MerR family transcriptional regulator [Lactobacillus sp. ESL0731]
MITSKKIQELTGLSARTLRYYEQLGLIKPERDAASNYRVYQENDVTTLQQILIFKKMGFKLSVIKDILQNPEFNLDAALELQMKMLNKQKQELEQVINNVKQTIQARKGEITMTDTEKFAGLKETLLQENEANYGDELRQKYGEHTYEAAQEKFTKISESSYRGLVNNETKLIQNLHTVLLNPEKEAELKESIFAEHQAWLKQLLPQYSTKIHLGIIQLYQCDSRFSAYYDKRAGAGATDLLVKICRSFLS